MKHATDKKRLYRHLELRNDHRSFLGEALFLLAHLAVGNANDVNHRALFLTGVAVAHGVISRREDRPLQHTHGSRGKLGKKLRIHKTLKRGRQKHTHFGPQDTDKAYTDSTKNVVKTTDGNRQVGAHTDNAKNMVETTDGNRQNKAYIDNAKNVVHTTDGNKFLPILQSVQNVLGLACSVSSRRRICATKVVAA